MKETGYRVRCGVTTRRTAGLLVLSPPTFVVSMSNQGRWAQGRRTKAQSGQRRERADRTAQRLVDMALEIHRVGVDAHAESAVAEVADGAAQAQPHTGQVMSLDEPSISLALPCRSE